MKARRPHEGMNLDFLMDTLTNVVGILILVLVLNSLNIRQAVERIREMDPSQFGVSAEQLEEVEQRLAEQRALLRELGPETFGLEARQLQDQAELEAKQQELEERERELAEATPEEPPAELEAIEEQQVELEEELARVTAERDEIQQRLEAMPTIEPPPEMIVRLPNPRPAPPDSEPARFVCREGGVVLFEPERLLEDAKRLIGMRLRPQLARAGPEREVDCERLVEEYNRQPATDRNFRTRLALENWRFFLYFELEEPGENIERLSRHNSRYRQAIRRLPTQNQFAQFLVWEDSFDVYVAARHWCDQQDVLAGWIPQTQDPIWRKRLDISVNCRGKPKPEPPKEPPPPPKEPPEPEEPEEPEEPKEPVKPPPPLPVDVID